MNIDADNARLEAFKTVSYKIWIRETYRAYRLAGKRSSEKNTPLFLIGFSLGGLIGADLFASYPDVHFDRMVLLSPAFRLHAITYFAKLLSPFPRLVIPSFSSKPYRMNNGTPMAAYNTLFETIKHFKKNVSQKVNIPTIIFIDKQDEFVSYKGLKRFVEKEKLDELKFYLLQKEKFGVNEKIHHQIIDEQSMGKNIWNEMSIIMIKHLLP